MSFNIYFAGAPFDTEVGKDIRATNRCVLLSQLNDRSTINKWIAEFKANPSSQCRLFIDSGAFSAWTKGKQIDVEEYIQFINNNAEYITVAASVDKIPGEARTATVASEKDVEEAAKATWENFLYMRSKMKDKSKLLYTFHVGEPWYFLKQALEYEDEFGSGYSANDTLRVQVRQPAKLDYDGAKLPVKVVQEDTVTLNINLMNTGKSTLYNCKVEYDIEGLESGGSSFAGEIPVGESKTATANLRVDSEKTGNVKGIIKITYEDAFGKTFEKEQEVKTLIEKKVIKAEKKEEEEKKNPLWWLFLLGGLVVGGGLGFGIPFAINSKKQREEDEKRL